MPQNLVALLHNQLQGSRGHPAAVPGLQGLSLCSPSGACYSLHHSVGPGAPPPPLQLAQLYAIQGSGCSAVAAGLGSRGDSRAEGATSLVGGSGQQGLSHVSCYGSRLGAGGESVAWMVSRQDLGVDLGPVKQQPVWTGLGLGTAWKLGAVGVSLGAAQAVAAARVSAFWQGIAWPVLRPVVQAGGHAAHAVGSVGQGLLGQVALSLRELLWVRTTRPLVLAAWDAVRGGFEQAVLPALLQASDRVRAGFEWLGHSFLQPFVQGLGHVLAAILNGLVWALLSLVSSVFEHILRPLLGVLVGLLVGVWQLLYTYAIAPFAGVIVLVSTVFAGLAVLLNKIGVSIMPRWRGRQPGVRPRVDHYTF